MRSFGKSIHAVVASALMACGAMSVSGQVFAKDVVRYQEYPGSIIHLGNWVMKEKGFCDKHNLDCQTINLANGPLAQQAAVAGSVDMIVSSMDVMMQAVSKGNDLVVVGPMIQNNLYSLSVGSHVDQPNKDKGYPENMKDLADKRIGVTGRGSATEMYVKTLLRGAGLNSDKVAFIGVGAPASAYAALMAKQVDAILSWDPIPALCEATGSCNVAVDMRKGHGPESVKAMNKGFVVWQAQRKYAEQNEDVIKRFLAAQNDAFVWLNDPANKEELNALVAKYFKLGDVPNREKVIELVVKETVDSYSDVLDPSVVDGFNNFLVSNELIPKPLDPQKLLHIVKP